MSFIIVVPNYVNINHSKSKGNLTTLKYVYKVKKAHTYVVLETSPIQSKISNDLWSRVAQPCSHMKRDLCCYRSRKN